MGKKSSVGMHKYKCAQYTTNVAISSPLSDSLALTIRTASQNHKSIVFKEGALVVITSNHSKQM